MWQEFMFADALYPRDLVYIVLVSYYMYVPYSRFLSWEKTFAELLENRFRGENFHELAINQCTTPTSAVSNRLKIDFCGENFRESLQKHEIRESFLPRKKPVYYTLMWCALMECVSVLKV